VADRSSPDIRNQLIVKGRADSHLTAGGDLRFPGPRSRPRQLLIHFDCLHFPVGAQELFGELLVIRIGNSATRDCDGLSKSFVAGDVALVSARRRRGAASVLLPWCVDEIWGPLRKNGETVDQGSADEALKLARSYAADQMRIVQSGSKRNDLLAA
jgi:hypothetical protein